jgi:cystathionine beta-lyase/cystathionine gamma-synthase
MHRDEIQSIIKTVLENLPEDWLRLTTHRLDIYNEKLAKTEFLEAFEEKAIKDPRLLKDLPTAFDYIRLGHPLSCILEWTIAKNNNLPSKNIISFSSQMMPILAVLRKNLFLKKKTRIIYVDQLPFCFDSQVLKDVYAYDFELQKVNSLDELDSFKGSTLAITSFEKSFEHGPYSNIDFLLSLDAELGSVLQVSEECSEYISEIQHVRRRESIAMTPHNCFKVLQQFCELETHDSSAPQIEKLYKTIHSITHTETKPAMGSCGLSVQYAIMMGLIHHAKDNYPNKEIKFIVPPNCYGGTNDQARRVAACIEEVEIIDLPVDAGKDMVSELERILNEVATLDAIPFIIAEIPTNPRVEIPDLKKLQITLSTQRKTSHGQSAIAPVFILDQTFCPNVKFLGEGDFLYLDKTISYVSGSKFPSGGLCTAGYAVANDKAKQFIPYIEKHLELCDNKATNFQLDILNKNMPSMNKRITSAYENTREFVDFIAKSLPQARINFVSHELAQLGFTPSVFSLDLPSIGESAEEKENHKRELNAKLINMMISEIPEDSKHCVSYGQLKGVYWTIPATSTQGTTKEGDKDYIVRVSIAPEMNLKKHKEVFKKFVETSY